MQSNSRAGKSKRALKGTEQGSVAAGSDPACNLLHCATSLDFVPKCAYLQGNPPYQACHHCCGCNYNLAVISLPHVCKQSATARQTRATARTPACSKHASQSNAVPSDAIPIKIQSKAMQSKCCNPKQCNPEHYNSKQCNLKQCRYNSRQDDARQCNFMQSNY